jgi:predicted phosphate transport protein (TIGR00153 family)
MNTVFSFFSPKDKKFQPLFEQCVKNLVIISETLVLALTTTDKEEKKSLIREIERLEQSGDDIAHSIFLELGKNFITPFDREDIHALVSALDDIADYIYATAINIDLYKIDDTLPEVLLLARLLEDMCKDLQIAILELRKLNNSKVIADVCIRINKGESQADHLCNTAIARLFQQETNAIELIKHKEILQTLEMASDKCDDVANVLEAILIKNA